MLNIVFKYYFYNARLSMQKSYRINLLSKRNDAVFKYLSDTLSLTKNPDFFF